MLLLCCSFMISNLVIGKEITVNLAISHTRTQFHNYTFTKAIKNNDFQWSVVFGFYQWYQSTYRMKCISWFTYNIMVTECHETGTKSSAKNLTSLVLLFYVHVVYINIWFIIIYLFIGFLSSNQNKLRFFINNNTQRISSQCHWKTLIRSYKISSFTSMFGSAIIKKM